MLCSRAPCARRLQQSVCFPLIPDVALCDCSTCLPSTLMAQPRAEARPLLAGLPDRGQALERQRDNLMEFVRNNQQAFDAMPYEPWTKVPSTPGPKQLEFDVRASTVVPGLRGVFPRHLVPASLQEQRLLFYPGLLMTDRLYQSFFEQYYCPTGLELPPLAYQDSKEQPVGVVIVGDPTSAGALINDGRYGRDDGQQIHHENTNFSRPRACFSSLAYGM